VHRFMEWWRAASTFSRWLIGGIGLAASILALLQAIPPEDERELILIERQSGGPHIFKVAYASDNETSLLVDQSNIESLLDEANGIISASSIRITSDIETTKSTVLIANSIDFVSGSEIRVPSGSITLLAPKIRDPRLDVSGASGSNGTSPGGHGDRGSNAGTIFLATAEAIRPGLMANGGNGGNGAQGANGAGGRRGECDGFGGYRAARNGAPGGGGGNAGKGGNGGRIEVYHRYGNINGTVSEGSPGSIGAGGSGGPGGRGCTGLGGTQPTRANGATGTEGKVATKGKPGVFSARRISFRDVLATYKDWAKGPNPDIEQLRTSIRKIATYTE